MTAREHKPAPWPAYGLGGLAIVAPQLLGGATGPFALAILLGGCLVCAVSAHWLSRIPSETLGRTPHVGWAALAAAIWTAIQALPLPCSWVAWAQPERHAIAEQLVSLGALQHEVCAISAAPGATWAAFGVAAVLAALLLTSHAISRAGGSPILVRSIAVSSALMALVALGHWVLGAQRVFGLFQVPGGGGTRVLLAPLINENHLAGHLALGFPLCLALAFERNRIDARIAWFCAAFLVFVTGILSLSRGGAAALAFGGVSYTVLVLLGSRRARGDGARLGLQTRLPLVLAVSVCLAAGLYVGLAPLEREFRADPQTWSKLELIGDMTPLAWAHPVVGVGRGAFGDVSPQTLLVDGRAMYPESLPLQWLVEWGWPCTLLLALALGLSFLRWWGSRRRGPQLALACGLSALGLQNLVDFSLELPGIATVAAVALGCLLAGVRRPKRPLPLALPSLTGVRIGTALAALGTFAATPWLTVWERRELARDLERISEAHPEQLATLLPNAFRGYPLEPSFVISAAWAAVRRQAPSMGRWLNLAMQLAPGWAGPHLAAGQLLEARGAVSQAAMEYGLAMERARWPASRHACDLLSRHPSAELAFAVADELSGDHQLTLEQLARCIRGPATATAGEQLAGQILAAYPSSEVALHLLVRAARQRQERELALTRAHILHDRHPQSASALHTLGELLLSYGQPAEVLALLEQSPALRDEAAILNLESHAALALGDQARFAAAVERALLRHGKTARARADIHRSAHAKLMKSGDYIAALPHAQSAYDMTGTPADLELVHLSAVQAGATSVALRTASELCQVRHANRKYCGSVGAEAPARYQSEASGSARGPGKDP